MKEWSIFLSKCLLYVFFWGGFVAIITNIDSNTINNLPVLANMIIVLFVFLAPIGISKLVWNKGEEVITNVKTKLNENKETKETIRATQESITTYTEAKSRFKYLSDELLIRKYEGFNKTNLDDMIKLALEEELVERKLITHSPMHEKLDAIMSKFNS